MHAYITVCTGDKFHSLNNMPYSTCTSDIGKYTVLVRSLMKRTKENIHVTNMYIQLNTDRSKSVPNVLSSPVSPLGPALGVHDEVGLPLEKSSSWHLFLLRTRIDIILLLVF